MTGVLPRIKQFFLGQEAAPKAKYFTWKTKTTREFYEGMDK